MQCVQALKILSDKKILGGHGNLKISNVHFVFRNIIVD